MDLQVVGLILIAFAILLAPRCIVMIHKENAANDRKERKERYAHNERIYDNRSFALYQDEETRRIDAEIYAHCCKQELRRKDREIERLKRLLEKKEEI